MRVLGIETSCDECAAAVVVDGRVVESNIVATQIPFHQPYDGVVPELASRMHTEWISSVVKQSIRVAGIAIADIDAVAVTSRPGLLGSLLVGLSFAKAFAWARKLPFIAVDHLLAHLYAPRLAMDIDYPYLGLLVSGGHTVICRVDGFDDLTILGTSLDDAVGEAFDKVAKRYGFGYPGGVAIEKLAARGDRDAYNFPLPKLSPADRHCDVSYSGLKTAVIHQSEQFRRPGADASPENIAASFQEAAINILLRSLSLALSDSGLDRVLIGGGVAANQRLRQRLAENSKLRCFFPPAELCGDNAAMIAGLGYRYLKRGNRSPWNIGASSRVEAFKRRPRN